MVKTNSNLVGRRAWLGMWALALRGADDGTISLFNGKDLTGWEGDRNLWLVEKGELVGRSRGIKYNDFLTTRDRFDSFLLKLEVRLVNNIGNSGVQFRSERVPASTECYGYQADIGPGWWGNLYDESRRRVTLVEFPEARRERVVKKDGWNEYAILAMGKRVSLALNGVITVDYWEPSETIARNGILAVQIHSGPPLEVRFRNIRIKPL